MITPEPPAAGPSTTPRRRGRRGRVVAAAVLLGLTVLAAGVALRADPVDDGAGVGGQRCATAAEARVPVGLSPGFVVLTDSVSDLRRDLDVVERLGVTRIRVDLSWAQLQPGPDSFDWSVADRVLGEITGRGIEVLAVVGYEPAWARRADADGRRLPVDPALFARFAGMAAARYHDQVSAWELWNEPNTRRFWGTRPDPAAYAALVAAAAPEIRTADPGAPVVVGAIAPAQDSRTELSPASFVTGLYDAVDQDDFDALSVHPYTYPERATGTQPYNTFFRLEQLHRIMSERGDGATPIWLTEYGAPTGTSAVAVTEQEQAAMVATAIAEARRRSYTGPIYVYSLRDAGEDSGDPEDNFGILRTDRSAKPAAEVVADGARASGPCR